MADGLKRLIERINGKPAPEAHGLPVASIETILVEASGGKVVRVQTPDRRFWIIQQRTWQAIAPTAAQVEQVGRWLASQAWMTGPYTIQDAAWKWPGWLAKSAGVSQVRAPERRDYEGE